MYFHVHSFKLQIHAHIYRSFIRHHKMLGVRIAKRKIEPQKPANPCGTRLCTCIFSVNTRQKLVKIERFSPVFSFICSVFQVSKPPDPHRDPHGEMSREWRRGCLSYPLRCSVFSGKLFPAASGCCLPKCTLYLTYPKIF